MCMLVVRISCCSFLTLFSQIDSKNGTKKTLMPLEGKDYSDPAAVASAGQQVRLQRSGDNLKHLS